MCTADATHAAGDAFNAADAHDTDGYGSSSSWLAAKAGMSKKAARTAVRQMRQIGERPLLGAALAAASTTCATSKTAARPPWTTASWFASSTSDVCVHRRGWQLILHPDGTGTTEARSPDGRQILRSHAPPAPHAA
jgi:hypothetical protein